MLPKLNRKRALFVLTKIDEILAWERQKEAERDTRFVELGRLLQIELGYIGVKDHGSRFTQCTVALSSFFS
jgi:hypothetical protein